jgi:serine/threonine protein kinase
MDAIRISDGTRVVLKSMSTRGHPNEIPIQQHFSSPPLASDPKNHCVPLYEVIPNPDMPERSFIVMPLLLPCDKPPFQTVGEVLDMLSQLIEVRLSLCGLRSAFADQSDQGLDFMHKQGVAHR